MNLEWKQRPMTDFIYIVKAPLKGLNRDQLYRQARCKGEFDTGYHFILHSEGVLEADRQETAVAGWNFENSTIALYILADTTEKLTDSQRIMLRDICKRYPEAEVIEIMKEETKDNE